MQTKTISKSAVVRIAIAKSVVAINLAKRPPSLKAVKDEEERINSIIDGEGVFDFTLRLEVWREVVEDPRKSAESLKAIGWEVRE